MRISRDGLQTLPAAGIGFDTGMEFDESYSIKHYTLRGVVLIC